ncbi:hypothetical protein PHLCEN_2v11843 [Hermanssonia centrifuga]|uniref:Uncharacterized protein n=1 Tax=Hermanssonia centrifuga TaxID=98765 RepID=A0A2R6NIX4_9APHY|nr:hypothetical protein PHLCEN_2v11843 [Hermanssonia centrifuga]
MRFGLQQIDPMLALFAFLLLFLKHTLGRLAFLVLNPSWGHKEGSMSVLSSFGMQGELSINF